jgi:hypothetical protein
MTHINKLTLGLMGMALLGLFSVRSAHAVNPQYLDIKVSIASNKSLSAGTTIYNFGGIALNTSSNSATALVITNDSGSYVENYRLQAANAISDTGGQNWTLDTSTSPNHYALAGQFSTARPDNADATWDATDYMTSSPQTCTDTQFGNGTLGEAGNTVSPLAGSRDRNLWFRIHTPDVSTGTEGRTAQVTLSVE